MVRIRRLNRTAKTLCDFNYLRCMCWGEKVWDLENLSFLKNSLFQMITFGSNVNLKYSVIFSVFSIRFVNDFLCWQPHSSWHRPNLMIRVISVIWACCVISCASMEAAIWPFAQRKIKCSMCHICIWRIWQNLKYLFCASQILVYLEIKNSQVLNRLRLLVFHT